MQQDPRLMTRKQSKRMGENKEVVSVKEKPRMQKRRVRTLTMAAVDGFLLLLLS